MAVRPKNFEYPYGYLILDDFLSNGYLILEDFLSNTFIQTQMLIDFKGNIHEIKLFLILRLSSSQD